MASRTFEQSSKIWLLFDVCLYDTRMNLRSMEGTKTVIPHASPALRVPCMQLETGFAR